MVEPRSYTGYNDKNEVVIQLTATDANTLINPAEVQAKIDNIGDVADDEIAILVSNLQSITSDEKDAVIVQGTNMDEMLSETQSAVNKIKGTFAPALGEVYTAAETAHDNLQNQLNEQAHSQVQSTSGVVTVSG